MTVFPFVWQITLCAALAADPSPVIVRVNGKPITRADVDFLANLQQIPADQRLKSDTQLIEQLIDQQLIRAFLASKKVQPLADELQLQIARAEELIKKRGADPKELFAKMGYSPERLKSELGLPLAWQAYCRQAISPAQVKAHFEQHRQELDGTQLRGSQIFLKVSDPNNQADITEKKQRLKEVRQSIVEGKTSFAEAAKQHSEAPSAQDGGDIGLFGWRGKLPAAVSQAAFQLKDHDVSEPVVSPLGVHLIQVTERQPGDLSLEDVRPEIFNRLSTSLWKSTANQERSAAKIEWAGK